MSELMIRDPFIPIPEGDEFVPKPGEYIQPWIYGIAPLINDTALTVNSGYETRKYTEIAAHPEVKSALDWRIHSCFSTDLSFKSSNDYERFPAFEAIDDKALRLIDDQLAKLTYQSFTMTLKTALKNALVYGFAAGEINWDDYDDDQMIYWITSIKFHAPFWYDFYIDAAGELKEIWYRGELRAAGSLIEKHIIAPYPFNLNWNYYGTSELQSVYHDVKLLQLMERMQATGAKALMVRPILHWYSANGRKPEEIAAVRNVLLNLDQASIASLPMLTGMSPETESKQVMFDKIEVLEDRASADGVEQIQSIVDYLRKRISRVLGRPDDLGYTTTTVGSQAKATVEAEVAASVHLADQAWITDIVSRHIVPAILKYNFPQLPNQYRMPIAYFQPLEAEWMGKQTESLMQLIDSGVLDARLDNVQIRQALGLWQTPSELLDPQPARASLEGLYPIKAAMEAGILDPVTDNAMIRKATGLEPAQPGFVPGRPLANEQPVTAPPGVSRPPFNPTR